MGRKNKTKRLKKKALADSNGNSNNSHLNGDVNLAGKQGIMMNAPSETTTTTSTSITVVQEPPPVANQTRLVLIQARKDLNNAKLPLVASLVEPLRASVLDPTMALATIVVPGIITKLPLLDCVAATTLKIPFSGIKFAYGLLPFRSDAHNNIDLNKIAQNDLTSVISAGSSPLPPFPTNVQSLLLSSFAFGTSALVDVATALLHPAKAISWLVTLWQVCRFLDASQLDNNLQSSIVTPIYTGRLIDNISIYRNQQESMQERTHQVKRWRRSQVQSLVNSGSRYMKFATAAYGTSMIQASALVDENDNHKNISSRELSMVKSSIAQHVGIKKSDIKHLQVSEGGNVKLLRHFLCLDRSTRNVVLSIRGTLSVSGALIDVNAQDVDFCTGKAHQGMSEMAMNLWNAVGGTIQELFTNLDSTWGLVITGHSLGAGTAALLNILVHVQDLLPTRETRCFGFASPPVFLLTENDNGQERDSVTSHNLDKAIKNCTCFVQGQDVVPFLSISSVSKLSAQLEAVDSVTENVGMLDRMAIASGKKDTPQELVDAVENVETPVVDGASRLTLAAEKIVWMFPNEEENDGGNYNVIGCLADELANLDIFLSADMISHHFPKNYEDSLDALAK